MEFSAFRKHAHEIVDWLADYLEGIERHPVRAQTAPGAVSSALPSAPAERWRALRCNHR